MLVTAHSYALAGIAGVKIQVEVNLAFGIPAFDVVGLPDLAVKESRERVRAALKNCGYEGPYIIEREISGDQQTKDIAKARDLIRSCLGE